MRKYIGWGLLIALSCAAIYQWRAHKALYRSAGRAFLHGTFPCTSPIRYSIGAVDPRFNLSNPGLAAHLAEAETAWERALHKDLFEFVPSSGDVTVNLIYDRRQAALDKLKKLGLRAEQSLEFYKTLKARYDELAVPLPPRQAALAARLAAYKRGEAVYNSRVGEYNRRGAATPRQVRRLDAARAALEREFAAIKKIEDGVNSDIDLLNALATTLNQLIVQLDLSVAQYNREGSALGTYEEGFYRISGGVRTIDLYKYADGAQFARLLAHEMGHALGLDHVADPAAMMYPVNRGAGLAILPADQEELAWACTSPLRRAKRKPAAGVSPEKIVPKQQ